MKKTVFWVCFAILSLCYVRWAHPVAAQEVRALVENLEVGDPVYYDNLTIIPIYNSRSKEHSRYATLDEALNQGWLEVTEMGRGHVPQLRVSNHSFRPIFIMGGEILSGGRQDRIVSRDVLLGLQSRNVIIPVYCTEQGRWEEQTPQFYSKGNLGTWKMRSTAQYAGSGAQHTIWNDISSSAQKMNVRSRTSAYQEAYEDTTVRRRVSRHEQYFHNIPTLAGDTVGAIVAVGNEIVSIDIFANPDLFRKLWPKILKSSSLAAVSHGRYGQIDQRDAVRILRQIHDAHFYRRSAVDQGVELTAHSNGVNVNALLYRGTLLHLAAFPAEYSQPVYRPYEDHRDRTPVMPRFRFK